MWIILFSNSLQEMQPHQVYDLSNIDLKRHIISWFLTASSRRRSLLRRFARNAPPPDYHCVKYTRVCLRFAFRLGIQTRVLSKVNSAQEAWAKCFAVDILKFEILQTIWNNKTKSIKMLDLLIKNWKIRVWCSLFHFFSCEQHEAFDASFLD